MVGFKRFLPQSGNYFVEGWRLALLNSILLLLIGGIAVGLLGVAAKARNIGLPLPLPVWLVLLGTGVPSFILWFSYGKAFAIQVVDEPYFIRGLAMGILGDVPGWILLYILITANRVTLINPEIHRIMLIMLLMYIIAMPIMIILGILDIKQGRLF